MPEQFWTLGKFGLLQAEEKKLHKFKGLNILKDADKLKFYYGKGPYEGFASFSLFTNDMFYV